MFPNKETPAEFTLKTLLIPHVYFQLNRPTWPKETCETHELIFLKTELDYSFLKTSRTQWNIYFDCYFETLQG